MVSDLVTLGTGFRGSGGRALGAGVGGKGMGQVGRGLGQQAGAGTGDRGL